MLGVNRIISRVIYRGFFRRDGQIRSGGFFGNERVMQERVLRIDRMLNECSNQSAALWEALNEELSKGVEASSEKLAYIASTVDAALSPSINKLHDEIFNNPDISLLDDNEFSTKQVDEKTEDDKKREEYENQQKEERKRKMGKYLLFCTLSVFLIESFKGWEDYEKSKENDKNVEMKPEFDEKKFAESVLVLINVVEILQKVLPEEILNNAEKMKKIESIFGFSKGFSASSLKGMSEQRRERIIQSYSVTYGDIMYELGTVLSKQEIEENDLANKICGEFYEASPELKAIKEGGFSRESYSANFDYLVFATPEDAKKAEKYIESTFVKLNHQDIQHVDKVSEVIKYANEKYQALIDKTSENLTKVWVELFPEDLELLEVNSTDNPSLYLLDKIHQHASNTKRVLENQPYIDEDEKMKLEMADIMVSTTIHIKAALGATAAAGKIAVFSAGEAIGLLGATTGYATHALCDTMGQYVETAKRGAVRE
jgi:hypothetical protein